MNVPDRIKSLSLKWKKGTMTEAERGELNDWYDQPLPQSIELNGADEERVKGSLFLKINTKIQFAGRKKVRVIPLWAKVAASLILVSGLLAISYRWFNNTASTTANEIIAATGGIKRIILSDSSIVWLKGHSKLIYPATFVTHEREVVLIGEALFEIKHDDKHPFVVKAGNYETTVLGTSFNLNSGQNGQGFELAVLSGKVGVLNRSIGEANKVVFVTANQTFKGVTGGAAAVPIAANKDILPSIIAGTQYDMAFRKTAFEDIMQRFEQKFDVKFEGYTGEYKSCRVTADLTDQSLEQSLKLLCSAINATYKIHENKIQLTGGGCFDE